MKNIYHASSLFILLVISISNLFSQSMIDTANVWLVRECGVDITNPGPTSCSDLQAYILRNPVISNGKTYYQLYKGHLVDEETNEFGYFNFTFMLLREKNEKVYFKHTANDNEFLIYDFSLEAGDVFQGSYTTGISSVFSIDLANGETRNFFILDEEALFPDYESLWVDGIGSNFFPFEPHEAYSPDDVWEVSQCFYSNGELAKPLGLDSIDCPESISIIEPMLVSNANVEPPALSVYPNPAGDWLRVEVPYNSSNAYQLRIYDNQGRLVKSERNFVSQSQVDISQLVPGIYHLKLISGTETMLKKIMIK